MTMAGSVEKCLVETIQGRTVSFVQTSRSFRSMSVASGGCRGYFTPSRSIFRRLMSRRLRRRVRRVVGKLSRRYQGMFVLDHCRNGDRRRVTTRLNVSMGAIGCRVGGTLGTLHRSLASCVLYVLTLRLFLFAWLSMGGWGR